MILYFYVKKLVQRTRTDTTTMMRERGAHLPFWRACSSSIEDRKKRGSLKCSYQSFINCDIVVVFLRKSIFCGALKSEKLWRALVRYDQHARSARDTLDPHHKSFIAIIVRIFNICTKAFIFIESELSFFLKALLNLFYELVLFNAFNTSMSAHDIFFPMVSEVSWPYIIFLIGFIYLRSKLILHN